MHRRVVRVWLTALVISALTSFGASAQKSVPGVPPLLLLLAGCGAAEGAVPYIVGDNMLALLRVELSPAQVLVVREAEWSPAAHGQDIMRLSVCGDHANVARVTGTGIQDAQEVDLSGLTEGARARTLALVLSGLGSTTEARTTPTPQAERPPTQPSRSILDPELKPRPPSPLVRQPGTELGAGVEMRTYPAPNTVIYGLRLTARFPRYVVGALALASRETQAVGVVSLAVVAGTVGYALVRRARNPSLGLDLSGELGATWASGSAFSAASAEQRTALHTSAGLSPWLHVRLSPHWITTVALFAGYSRGLQAHIASERVATSHGPFIGIAWSIAFRSIPSRVPALGSK